MTQLVVVHGVATRSGPSYDVEVANRDALFTKILLNGAGAIRNPLWGPSVAPLLWKGASFQRSSEPVAAFSMMGSGVGAGQDAPPPPDPASLIRVAQSNANAALDAVFAELVEQANQDGRALQSHELVQFEKAAAFLQQGEPNTPLEAPDVPELAKSIHERIAFDGNYGIGDTLIKAANAVAGRARHAVGAGVLALGRDSLNPFVALFLGDIFAYLNKGPVRDAIRSTIVTDLNHAFAAAKAGHEKLVVIGHSLGGVILYDLFSDPAGSGLSEGFHVDAFITVGSQPGLFAEMGLVGPGGHPAVPPTKIAGPDCVGDWLNVIDPIDLFGFKAEPIFDRASDFSFDSQTGLLGSHTSYFSRPIFHARLRAHLVERDIA
jgi:hypothetical protein